MLTYCSASLNQKSPFLLLPAEIRNVVYSHVLSCTPIRVCFATTYATRAIDTCPYAASVRRHYSHIHYSHRLLSLIETCRQIYTETRVIPFNINTFIGFPEAITAGLSHNLYRHQFDCVTAVHLLVQTADIIDPEREIGYECVRARQNTAILNTAVEVICRLARLRKLRVTWESREPREGVWERFEVDLARSVIRHRRANRFAIPATLRLLGDSTN